MEDSGTDAYFVLVRVGVRTLIDDGVYTGDTLSGDGHFAKWRFGGKVTKSRCLREYFSIVFVCYL